MSFATLKTGIDGLDGILGGGIRYPDDAAVFLCIAGGPGTGKTMLALELVVRAWLEGEDGATFLYYSVEHTPESLEKKLRDDFDWFGAGVAIEVQPKEVPGRLVLTAKGPNGETQLTVTQARPASLLQKNARGTTVDIDWILAEIENHQRAAPVSMVVIDNVGLLLTDLEYFEKRTTLLETRRRLLSAVFASPQPQCAEPAKGLADGKQLELTIEPRLRDQDMGSWQGRAWQDIARKEGSAVQTFFSEFGDSKAPGGESLGDAVERMLEWWAETMPKVAGQALAVVMPGSLLSGFAAAMLGMRLSRCVSLNLPHGGIGVLDAFQNGVRISTWNPTAAKA